MKKLFTISMLLIFLTFVSAQAPMSGERLLTPDSSLTLQDGNYSRVLTGAQLKKEFEQYEAEKQVANGAYRKQIAPEKIDIVIPMAYEDRAVLARQQELFEQTTLDFVDMSMPQGRVSEKEFSTGYNRQWGQKDKFAAYIDAMLKIYGSKEYRSLDAHCNAGGYVFNYHARALEFNMSMRSGSNPSAHTALKIFGKTKFSYSGTTVYKKVYFQDEVGKTVHFFIGPIPVSVRGSIGGSAGFDAGVSVVGVGIKGQITPGITSYGAADAGVDLWFVKVGVEGSMEIINDHLPASVTVQLLPDLKTLEIAMNVTNNLKALAGKVVIFVKVKEFWKFWKNSWKKYSTTLFSWNGYQKTWVLFDKSLKIPLN